MPFDGKHDANVATANSLQRMADYLRKHGFCCFTAASDKRCFIGAAFECCATERALAALKPHYVPSFDSLFLQHGSWTDERAASACELAREDILKGQS